MTDTPLVVFGSGRRVNQERQEVRRISLRRIESYSVVTEGVAVVEKGKLWSSGWWRKR